MKNFTIKAVLGIAIAVPTPLLLANTLTTKELGLRRLTPVEEVQKPAIIPASSLETKLRDLPTFKKLVIEARSREEILEAINELNIDELLREVEHVDINKREKS